MKKNIYGNATNSAVFVLASLLKYAKDVRMYEKIGKSLIKKYKNDIFHFVGHTSTNTTPTISDNKTNQNVYFHELFNFNRLSLKRFFTSFIFFFFLLKAKPNTIIIGTFELLLPAVFYKIFCLVFFRKKLKIIYDIQENYFANIKYTKVFLPVLRDFLAFYVFLIQKTTSFFIDFFFLAEFCYEKELTFIGKKYEILPNFILKENLNAKKETSEASEKNKKDNIKSEKTTHLLFLGTISKEYGLYKLLCYFDFLTKNEKKNETTTTQIKLTILGHCPLAEDFLKIEKISQKNPFVSAQISQKPIPYAQIKEKMENSSQENEFENTFVVMPYLINKSYEKRIPTKFYECLAYDLPMIIQKNKYWETFFEQMQNLVPTHKINVFFIDFDNKKTDFGKQISSKILHQKNSKNTILIDKLPIFWDICEEKINKINFY